MDENQWQIHDMMRWFALIKLRETADDEEARLASDLLDKAR